MTLLKLEQRTHHQEAKRRADNTSTGKTAFYLYENYMYEGLTKWSICYYNIQMLEVLGKYLELNTNMKRKLLLVHSP